MPNLGLSAKEFTALYLEGRQLHLMLKRARKSDETSLALVFLDDIGLFQNVIVDHGLAVIDPPASLPRGGMEAGLLSGLQEHETAAKKQSSPQGGWGLKGTP